MSPIKIPCRLLKTRCMSSKRRLSYPKICPAKRNLLRKNKISPSQKRSRPCQTKRVRKKKDFTWVFPTCFFRTRSCLTRKSFIRPKQNFFWSKKILSSKNKTFFPKTKFCPARTKLFLVKKDFVRRKQNLFRQKKILSGRNKIFSGQKRFCPTKTKSFLPGRDFFCQTRKEVSMAVTPKHVRVLLPYNTQPDHDVEEIGGSVLGNLYIPPGKNNFPTPPVDQATLQTGLNDDDGHCSNCIGRYKRHQRKE